MGVVVNLDSSRCTCLNMQKGCESNSSVEIQSQDIVDNMHPAVGEDGHIEALVQPPGDLDAEKHENKKDIEVILANF